jgi:hypothetical protein
MVDDYTRECPALVADTSLPGARVARKLTGLIGMRGKPHTVVSDNGTKLTSSAVLRWSQTIKHLSRRNQTLPLTGNNQRNTSQPVVSDRPSK